MARLPLFALIALLQTAPIQDARLDGIAADVERMARSSTNEERFDAITALLRARNLTFTVEPFTIEAPIGKEPRTGGRNIVVALGEGVEDIVIGAHFDAARLQDGSLSKGAVDNAASSVLLVRLAEALRAEQLGLRVRIVWFDMEELGLIGSARYVERHGSERVRAMLNFDINAYGDTVLFGPSERSDNRALRRSVVETCARENVACVGFPQMPPGDDRSFVRAGVPTISLAILPAVETHQIWLLMNGGAGAGLASGAQPAILRTIHTAGDTPAMVREADMAMTFRFGLSLVRRLAAPAVNPK
ncbi:MAG: M28 family metallopeptidase [Vicinamibacterales bacterium]